MKLILSPSQATALASTVEKRLSELAREMGDGEMSRSGEGALVADLARIREAMENHAKGRPDPMVE